MTFQYDILILNSYVDYILRGKKRAKNINNSIVLIPVEISVLPLWDYFKYTVGYSK